MQKYCYYNYETRSANVEVEYARKEFDTFLKIPENDRIKY